MSNFLAQQPDVVRVLNAWAINHGNDVMLAVKVELSSGLTVSEAVVRINALEQAIKTAHPRVKWVFFEIDNKD